MINSLKLLTNQKKDGDSPVETIVTDLLKDGPRKFIAADNHEAVKVGGLRRRHKSFKVVKPKFTTDFCGAPSSTASMWRTRGGGLPPVDAVCHALCQAVYWGIEGLKWEAMYDHCEELHQAVRTIKPGDNQRRKLLWATNAAQDREE